MAGHGDRDAHRRVSRRHGEGPAGAAGGGGEQPVLIHRARRSLDAPGEAPVLGGEVQVAPDGRGGQAHLLAGEQVQGGDALPALLLRNGNAVRGGHHREPGRARIGPVPGGHLDRAALRPGGVQAVCVHRAAAAGHAPAHGASGVHGVVGAVQPHGGELHLGPRQQDVVAGGHIVPRQLPGGLQVGGEENGGGVGPLRPLGGPVHHLHPLLVRVGGPDGGGAAAVHADGLHAPQLGQPLGHLGNSCPHAVPALPAVHGVEHQGAVSLDTHGGAGGAGGVQP